MEKEIICLVGPRGSGKDFNANKLASMGAKKLALADPVRDIAWMLLNWKPSNEEEYERFKIEKLNPNDPSSVTGRQFLVNVGDGLRRQFGDDIWIDKLIEKIETTECEKNSYVISDVRYANEIIKLSRKYSRLIIIFTNYKSERYEAVRTPSEILSYELLQLGYEDMRSVSLNVIYELKNKFGDC